MEVSVGVLLLFIIGFTQATTEQPKPWERNETVEGDLRPRTFYYSPEQEEQVRKSIICRGFPCMPFSVVADRSFTVQERHYQDLDIVVSTVSECADFTSMTFSGYLALYSYRHGNNTQGAQLPMTTPVVVEVSGTSSTQCPRTQKVWFYITKAVAGQGIPAPIEPNLAKTKVNTLDVYVHTFNGKMRDPGPELIKLDNNLKKLRLCRQQNRFFAVFYDNPWRRTGRRNEIWVEKKAC